MCECMKRKLNISSKIQGFSPHKGKVVPNLGLSRGILFLYSNSIRKKILSSMQ